MKTLSSLGIAIVCFSLLLLPSQTFASDEQCNGIPVKLIDDLFKDAPDKPATRDNLIDFFEPSIRDYLKDTYPWFPARDSLIDQILEALREGKKIPWKDWCPMPQMIKDYNDLVDILDKLEEVLKKLREDEHIDTIIDLREMLKAMDLDKDGCITLEELETYMDENWSFDLIDLVYDLWDLIDKFFKDRQTPDANQRRDIFTEQPSTPGNGLHSDDPWGDTFLCPFDIFGLGPQPL